MNFLKIDHLFLLCVFVFFSGFITNTATDSFCLSGWGIWLSCPV